LRLRKLAVFFSRAISAAENKSSIISISYKQLLPSIPCVCSAGKGFSYLFWFLRKAFLLRKKRMSAQASCRNRFMQNRNALSLKINHICSHKRKCGKEFVMRKDFFSRCALVLMLGFTIITLAGCDTLGEVFAGVSDGLNKSSNSFSNEYSSKSTAGLYYSIYNQSSYSVTISDSTGSHTLSPGDSFTARFNKEATIYNVYYSPSDKVKVSQSGTSFTFTNK
jgi:hypothetical protein